LPAATEENRLRRAETNVIKEGQAMKAFLASVVAAILIAVIAGVVLKSGVGLESSEVNQSTRGTVRL